MSTTPVLGGTIPDTEGEANKVATYKEYINTVLEPAIGGLQTWVFTDVVTFTNSWVNFGGAYHNAGYAKVGNIVRLRGLIKSGTSGTSAFTLPVGYRPAKSVVFASMSNAAFAYIEIAAAGTVSVVGSNVGLSLDCSFSTAS